MKGLQLRSLSGELLRVSRTAEAEPAGTIADAESKFGKWHGYLQTEFEGRFSFPADCHKLPLKTFEGFSFEELCKLYYSSSVMMDKSVGTLFETNARYEIVRKIQSSMWRWGVGRGTWNEVVDAYNRIRNFTFHPDFEIRLDHTTYYNEYGPGKYSRVYLDGVFAYLVYYKRKHAMTIGFSIQEKRNLLIQQVQVTNRSGNRCLYRLPQNRLEFVIDLFRKNFLGYRLWVIDGVSLVDKTLADYHQGLGSAERVGDADKVLAFRGRIEHLEADKPRLTAFYSNTGHFRLGSSKKILGLVHHRVSVS